MKLFSIKTIVIIVSVTTIAYSCKPKSESKKVIEDNSIENLLESRYTKLLNYDADSVSFPRSMSLNPETIYKVSSKDWTAGFFPGNLWHLYQLTGEKSYKEKAKIWTRFMENQKRNDRTHDMGFKIFCSFGEGNKIEENDYYKNVIIESARTLITRFHKKIGAIRSWDFNREKWEFPVIVDNMMNLELLFEATKISGDSIYFKIAKKHAETTLKNHIRKDNSFYHVAVYDTISGTLKNLDTHQGFNTASAWSRGQAWGIYGFTMAYRYTNKPEFLAQAEATAKYFIQHENLPEEGIPYWDFNDPDIPNAPRDASAAAIVASALFELYEFTKNQDYLNFANKVLTNLSSTSYLLNDSVEGPFILNHSTGNWPKNDEINEPIVYADYYFLEAILRKKQL